MRRAKPGGEAGGWTSFFRYAEETRPPHPGGRDRGARRAAAWRGHARAARRARAHAIKRIDRRVEDGRLWRVHRGVYAVGRPTLTLHGRFIAAVLSCGPGAAFSHIAAGVLLGVLKERGARIDVTVPARRAAAPAGRRDHPSRPLPAADVTTKHGIPVTTPARTLIDLADVLPRRQLERALDEAAYLRLDVSGLQPRPGRRGSRRCWRNVLAAHARRHHAHPLASSRSACSASAIASVCRRPKSTPRSRATRPTSSGAKRDCSRKPTVGRPTAPAPPSSVTAVATPTCSPPAGACSGSAMSASGASRTGWRSGLRRRCGA